MNQIIKHVFFITLFALFLSACASTLDPSEAYKGESPEAIFQKGKTSLKDNNYQEAIKRFEALNVQYPFVPENERAQLFLTYAYYMKEDYALAVATADQFIRMHPTSPDVPYAYYMRGVSDYYQNMGVIERMFTIDLATRDLKQIHKSYDDFNMITTHYPHSRFAPAARQYQIYLRNVLAYHEFHVAAYYYNKGAFVAANNRASELVARFQGSPAVRDALVLMAKANRQLGLEKEEQDVLAIIQANFPALGVDYGSLYRL